MYQVSIHIRQIDSVLDTRLYIWDKPKNSDRILVASAGRQSVLPPSDRTDLDAVLRRALSDASVVSGFVPSVGSSESLF